MFPFFFLITSLSVHLAFNFTPRWPVFISFIIIRVQTCFCFSQLSALTLPPSLPLSLSLSLSLSLPPSLSLSLSVSLSPSLLLSLSLSLSLSLAPGARDEHGTVKDDGSYACMHPWAADRIHWYGRQTCLWVSDLCLVIEERKREGGRETKMKIEKEERRREFWGLNFKGNPPIAGSSDANLNRYSCAKDFPKCMRLAMPFALLSFAEKPSTLSLKHAQKNDNKCTWQQTVHVAYHCATMPVQNGVGLSCNWWAALPNCYFWSCRVFSWSLMVKIQSQSSICLALYLFPKALPSILFYFLRRILADVFPQTEHVLARLKRNYSNWIKVKEKYEKKMQLAVRSASPDSVDIIDDTITVSASSGTQYSRPSVEEQRKNSGPSQGSASQVPTLTRHSSESSLRGVLSPPAGSRRDSDPSHRASTGSIDVSRHMRTRVFETFFSQRATQSVGASYLLRASRLQAMRSSQLSLEDGAPPLESFGRKVGTVSPPMVGRVTDPFEPALVSQMTTLTEEHQQQGDAHATVVLSPDESPSQSEPETPTHELHTSAKLPQRPWTKPVSLSLSATLAKLCARLVLSTCLWSNSPRKL